MNICGMGDILKMFREVLFIGIVGYKRRLIGSFNRFFVMGKFLFFDLKKNDVKLKNVVFDYIYIVKWCRNREYWFEKER